MSKKVRKRIADIDAIEYDDEEILDYLNAAFDYLSLVLASANDPQMVKKTIVKHNDPVPDDFISLVGAYPLNIVNGVFELLDTSAFVEIRYFAKKGRIDFVYPSSYEPKNSPFPSKYDEIIIMKASIYALNRNEYNVEVDEMLLNQLLQSVGVVVRNAKAQ